MKVHNVLGVLQTFVAVGAVPAGVAMILQPDGTGLGMSLEMLSASPFRSFMIPGIFLLLVHGLGNLAAAIGSFRKWRFATPVGMGLGVVLVIWILVQIYYIRPVHVLQLLYLLIGLGEWFLAFRLDSLRNGSQK